MTTGGHSNESRRSCRWHACSRGSRAPCARCARGARPSFAVMATNAPSPECAQYSGDASSPFVQVPWQEFLRRIRQHSRVFAAARRDLGVRRGRFCGLMRHPAIALQLDRSRAGSWVRGRPSDAFRVEHCARKRADTGKTRKLDRRFDDGMDRRVLESWTGYQGLLAQLQCGSMRGSCALWVSELQLQQPRAVRLPAPQYVR